MTFGRRSLVPLFVVLSGILAVSQNVDADVRLPGFFSDHMVSAVADSRLGRWG
jgi:hypothetical protein